MYEKLFKILESISVSAIVVDFEILRLIVEDGNFYIKMIVILKDRTTLRVTEGEFTGKRKYSYYWLLPSGDLIIGWDNVEHHKRITTFPIS